MPKVNNKGKKKRKAPEEEEEEDTPAPQFADEEDDVEDAGSTSNDAGGALELENDQESADSSSAPQKKKKSGGFQSMNLSEPVFRGIMKKGYRVPTPIQRKTIPTILAGHDVVAMARTGSGKTGAFLIPMLERLKSHSRKVGVRAVVLAPTRELALQTMKFFKELAKYTDLYGALLVGGDDMEQQFEELAKNPDVLIATPGRLVHHLVEAGLSLQAVEYVVFDEADRLFEMGFEEQLHELLKAMPETKQTLLFSATLPKLLVDFVKAGLKDPIIVRLDAESKVSELLQMVYITVKPDEKIGALLFLLREVVPKDQQTIVFAATRHHVEYIYQLLQAASIDSSQIYGQMDQTARKISLAKFRKNLTKVLVVTDVAARGIDIPLLDNVINFDFPTKPKLFVHRVGRTARNGRSGVAYSLVAPEEMSYLIDLHLFLGHPVQNQPPEGQQLGPKDHYYGSLPRHVLDFEVEWARETTEHRTDLSMLFKSMQNSMKAYWKTVSVASPESVRRAKALPPIEVHPLFKSLVPPEEKQVASFFESLRGFRPPQNILEITAKNSKTLTVPILPRLKKRPVAATAAREETTGEDASSEVTGEPAKEKKHRAVPVLPAKNYKDENFFLSATPADQHTEAGMAVREHKDPFKDLVLDMMPDDQADIQRKRSKLTWDRKKKKFVQTHGDVDINKSSNKKHRLLNESGAPLSKRYKTSKYEQWTQKTKKSIPQLGDHETRAPLRERWTKFKKKSEAPASVAKGELKDKEKIFKERKQKEKQKEFMNKQRAKHGKGGGAGKHKGGGGGRGGGGKGGKGGKGGGKGSRGGKH